MFLAIAPAIVLAIVPAVVPTIAPDARKTQQGKPRTRSAAVPPLVPALRIADLAARPYHNMLLRTPHSQIILDQLVLTGLDALCAAPVPLHAFAANMVQLAVTTTAC